MNKKIQINLLSDLCSHSGDTYNSYIDTDVVYDKYGFPYIPAKRLKGCIREACLELVEFGAVSQADFDKIWGKEGKDTSSVIFDNAYLKDYKDLIADVNQINDMETAHPQAILRLYTYVRTQTALNEDGVADTNTLRTIRVVKRGEVLESSIEIADNLTKTQMKALEDSVRMVKHIGINRTRGLGLVDMKVCAETSSGEKDKKSIDNVKEMQSKVSCTNAKTVRINYKISLNGPAICKSEQGNQAVSQDFISGSKVLGLLIEQMGIAEYKNLSQDTVLKVSNAYIGFDGERCTPLSKSLQKVKDQNFISLEDEERKTLSVKDLLWNYTGGEQLTPVGSYYVTNQGYVNSVNKEIHYHHRRPEDKSIGRANGKNESAFYQLESISAGQVFYGYLEADLAMVKKLLALIPKPISSRIGYGRNAEYGAVNFEWFGCEEVKEVPGNKVTEFVVKLNSPVILYNIYGMPSADPQVLTKYIGEYLNCEGIKLEKVFAAYTTIGGYNVTWNSRKPTFTSLGAGTVCYYSVPEGVDCGKLSKAFIGERSREGYGEVELYTNRKIETCLYKGNTQRTVIPTDGKYKTNLYSRLNQMQTKQIIASDARKKASEIVLEKNLKTKKGIDAVVGRMIMMFRGENNLENFKKQIEGIETDSKRELALAISKVAESYINNPNEYVKADEVYTIFMDNYLGQIKYMIRKPKQKGEKNNEE